MLLKWEDIDWLYHMSLLKPCSHLTLTYRTFKIDVQTENGTALNPFLNVKKNVVVDAECERSSI